MDDALLTTLLTTLLAEVPDPLAARVRGLHRCARYRARHLVCRQVADTLRTAALCLRYGEAPTALELLRTAVDVADQPGHGHPVTPGGWPPGLPLPRNVGLAPAGTHPAQYASREREVSVPTPG